MHTATTIRCTRHSVCDECARKIAWMRVNWGGNSNIGSFTASCWWKSNDPTGTAWKRLRKTHEWRRRRSRRTERGCKTKEKKFIVDGNFSRVVYDFLARKNLTLVDYSLPLRWTSRRLNYGKKFQENERKRRIFCCLEPFKMFFSFYYIFPSTLLLETLKSF